MLKKRNVFCLILTELFLLKYIHKHMIGVPFLFGVISFFSQDLSSFVSERQWQL